MPHALHAHRDAIDALVGPIEQIVADLNNLKLDRKIDYATFAYTLGGLEQAMETLLDTVNAIDEWYEPEPEPVEDDEPDEDESDDHDTSDDEE